MFRRLHETERVVSDNFSDGLQVIRDLSGPPNYWDMDRIENNMFRRYNRSDLDGSLYDSHSIMHYRLVYTQESMGERLYSIFGNVLQLHYYLLYCAIIACDFYVMHTLSEIRMLIMYTCSIHSLKMLYGCYDEQP